MLSQGEIRRLTDMQHRSYLQSLSLEKPPRHVRVTLGNLPVNATVRVESDQAFIGLAEATMVNVGDELVVELVQ